ncbi:MAG TPA: F0F1 ATP synthase subunit B [Opitutaceae bacterium]|jgi:F-type H+-transporting ATPase subunit b
MEAVTQIAQQFGLRVPFLVAQCINFVVVASLLWYFAFKPVLKTITERQQKIDDGLKYADEMKAKLEETQKLTEQRLQQAALEGQRLVEDARKAAKEFSERQQKEATEKATALIEKAQAAIELERRKMLAETRTEIARLVVETTQRVLAKELPANERAKYNEAAARELTEV